jgi:putative ABC transport system permease protein
MYTIRILRNQPLRLVLTIGGISLCIVLMLFLLAIYRGVADGSVEYIRENKTDLWILQRNATNILRGSSILSTGYQNGIRGVPGVRSISAVLLLLSTVKKEDTHATIFLAGYDHKAGIGGPPQIVEGRPVQNDDEIVLDKSFAAKLNFTVGDQVHIQDDSLRLVGLSAGTNALVIQYGFVTLHRAQYLIGFPSIVTCFLVTTEDEGQIATVAQGIRDELPGVEVYDHETFLQNNIYEMESGFLPLLYTIAAIGAIVLTAILSLLLSINILERRKDFAVLKTLGSPTGFLRNLVIQLALLITTASSIAALALFFPLTAIIERIAPEVSTKSSPEQILVVLFIVAVMSLLSSFISVQRVRRIYPLEAFS